MVLIHLKLIGLRYFHIEDGQSYIEKMIKFGNKIQQNKSSTQIDIFGGAQEIELESPAPMIVKNGQLWIYFKRKRSCWYISIRTPT